MNAVTFNPIFSQVSGVPAQGLENKAATLPFSNSFAALLSGFVDTEGMTPQSPEGVPITLDGLLAQIDQLLAQLTNQQEDSEESDDLLDETLLSDSTMQMMPTTDLANLINILFGSKGATFDEAEGFTSVLPESYSSVGNNVQLLSTLAGLLTQSNHVDEQQSLQTVLIQSNQQQLLQSLQVIMHAAKEGQVTMTQEELGKLSQFIDQISGGNDKKLELQRGALLGENKSYLFKGMDSHNFTRVVTQVSESNVNQTGSQHMQQEQSSSNSGESSTTTTKVGFHQMMMVNIHNNAQPSIQADTSTPVVRAHHFQNDMNDFLVRQLQMTRLPNGVSEARIKLFPENLGSVDVKLTVSQGVLTAMFMAETRAGKELLESQLAGLRASLLSSGLQVDKLEVNMPNNQNNGQAQDSMYRQGSDQRNQQAEVEDVFLEDEPEEDFSTVFAQFSQAI